jgi:uncharacterized protein (DUF1697 family)
MTDLKGIFESFGLQDVSAYVQSGNILFDGSNASSDVQSRELSRKLSQALGHQNDVFVMSRKSLEEAVANNPFKEAATDKKMRIHLMFLSAKPSADAVRELMAIQGEEYHFFVHDKVLYYTYSREYDGRRRNIDFEKVLGVVGTSRTWKVVSKLIELLIKAELRV